MKLVFEFTDEEAAVASSRAAWRAALADGLLSRHLGPLTAFVLALLFAATLGWTGLISHRAAETTLIASAAIYMIYRLTTRRRFWRARRDAQAWARRLREAGPAEVSGDEAGFRLTGAGLDRSWRFADGLEIEAVSGLVFVWPHAGEPLVWPSRAHATPDEAEAALADLRRRTGARALAAAVDDDD